MYDCFRRARKTFSVGLALALLPCVAEAQRSNTEKLMVGFSLAGASIDSDDLDIDTETGSGATLQLGYGFSPLFTLVLDGSAAQIDGDENYLLAHFDILARFNFGSPVRAVVPFVEVGFAARSLSRDNIEFEGSEVDLEITGGGFTFGGGLSYYVSPTVGLTAGLKFTSGEFSTVRIDNVSVDGFDIDARSSRINIGVTWYPMRKQ